jgi:hypothetical protein
VRSFACLILLAALAGCAANPPLRASRTLTAAHEPAAAAALVFDPPIVSSQAPLALWREPRLPSAFVGFDDLSSTYIYVRTDDRQSNFGDRYERRAITEHFGATYR